MGDKKALLEEGEATSANLETNDHSCRPQKKTISPSGLAIVIMGVSGSGKSSVGETLAGSLNCSFLEADDFHSRANKGSPYRLEKMRKGIALTDEDRTPWLEELRDATREHTSSGRTVVLACSALKRKHRDILRSADTQFDCRVRFVCLEAPAEVIAIRMQRRLNDGAHFMPVNLLKSQLDSLQIDDDEGILRLDATLSIQSLARIVQANMNI